MQTQPRQQDVIPPPTRRGLSRVEAARYVGVSPATFDKMIASGEMPRPKRVGSRKIWDVRSVDLAFDALPGDDALSQNEWDSVFDAPPL